MLFCGQLTLACLVYLSSAFFFGCLLPLSEHFLIETPLTAQINVQFYSVLFLPLLGFLCSSATYLSPSLSFASRGFIILLSHFLLLIFWLCAYLYLCLLAFSVALLASTLPCQFHRFTRCGKWERISFRSVIGQRGTQLQACSLEFKVKLFLHLSESLFWFKSPSSPCLVFSVLTAKHHATLKVMWM